MHIGPDPKSAEVFHWFNWGLDQALICYIWNPGTTEVNSKLSVELNFTVSPVLPTLNHVHDFTYMSSPINFNGSTHVSYIIRMLKWLQDEAQGDRQKLPVLALWKTGNDTSILVMLFLWIWGWSANNAFCYKYGDVWALVKQEQRKRIFLSEEQNQLFVAKWVLLAAKPEGRKDPPTQNANNTST